MPEFVAHTPNAAGRWQPLDEHLLCVARAAERFAEPFGAGALAHRAGLLHDIGKYSDEFQQYLQRCERARQSGGPPPKKGIDHKSAGARLAAEDRRTHTGSVLAYGLYGHHGGLPARSELQEALRVAANPACDLSIRRGLDQMPLLQADPPRAEDVRPLAGQPAATDVELFARMLFSCLVDADFLDTEAHFDPERRSSTRQEVTLDDMGARLAANQELLQAASADTTVNRVRREIYDACKSSATREPGVFRLTAPTGGGKTRSSLAFALAHAASHGLDRVIYAIPYTSIIDQTVGVFRQILGDDAPILEHHSAVADAEDANDAVADRERWRRLASENWDAPLVVTTTVQLFESLFARTPARCRKLHNLANSVIVLDEVQTLPLPLLTPIVDVLRSLVARYRVTVLLCTATQPALDQRSPYLQGFDRVVDILPDPEPHFRALQRVTYDVQSEPWSWERVAEEMRAARQCLAVVNTRKDALALLTALADRDALHLSTLLCGAHRRAVLDTVRHRLAAGEPCHLVSTQVVEAGVDLDFPVVMRAIGPFDRIIQAAGRCNREGNLASGRVVVFFPEEGRTPPGAYRTASDEARLLLARGSVDFDDPTVCERYFARLYQGVNTDGRGIQKDRRERHYPDVARKFRMIDEETVPVLVPYDEEREEFDALCAWAQRGPVSRAFWRRAQPLVVSLYQKDFEEATRAGAIEEIVPEQLYVWRGEYDPVTGLGDVARAARDPADLIV
jgi:CRISPR-associated endonuclease/helicase Cas3